MWRSVFALCLVFMVCVTPMAFGGTTTSLTITSPGGNCLGVIQGRVLTAADVVFDVETNYYNGVTANFHNGDYSIYGNFNVAAAGHVQLMSGDYSNATRYPFGEMGQNQIAFEYCGCGCNTATGDFTVKYVEYDGDGALVSFWGILRQSCEGRYPAFTVEFKYNLDAAVPVRPATWGALKTVYR